MKNLLIYSYALSVLLVSCQTNERQNSNEESKVHQENPGLVIEEVFEETTLTSESNYNDPKLFEHYHDLCSQKDWPEFVDASKIMHSYANYPNTNFESAFEWEVISIPYCTEELIFLHLQSFEEGRYNNYEVAINNNGLITQFELAGEQQSGEVQMKLCSQNTVQVTVIDKNAKCRNYLMNPVEDVFQSMEYGSSIGMPETAPVDSFELTINGQKRSMHLHTTNQIGADSKFYFDLYEENTFYYRLPPHPISDFVVEEIKNVFVGDINGDRKDDIIINASAITGIGAEGVVPFEKVSVYFQTEGWIFQNKQSFDTLINKEMSVKKIAEIFETQFL